MNKLFLAPLLLLSFLFVIAISSSVSAQDSQRRVIDSLEANPQISDNFGLPNTVKEVNDSTLQSALQSVFLAAGGVSFIFVVVGGLRYVLSEGNEQKIKQAKDTIMYSLVGLGVSLSAFIVVRFFLSIIVE
jgi:preprotein translocase subunit YajC